MLTHRRAVAAPGVAAPRMTEDEANQEFQRRFTAEERAIITRQGNKVTDVEDFITRNTGTKYDLVGDEEQMKTALEDVRRYVREDEPSSTISGKQKKKRLANARKKGQITTSALNSDAAITASVDEAQQELTDYNAAHVANPATANEKALILQELDLMPENFLSYKNDSDFVIKAPVWLKQIKKFELFMPLVTDNETYNKYFERLGIVENARQKIKDQIQDKVAKYTAQKEYITTKLELMKSPYYSLLAKDDLDYLSAEELEDKADFFDRITKPGLAVYVRNYAKLVRLKDVSKIKPNKNGNLVSSSTIRIRDTDGEFVTVTKKTEERLHSLTWSGGGSTGYSSKNLNDNTDKTDDDIKFAYNNDHLYENDEAKDSRLKKEKEKQEKEARGEKEEEKSLNDEVKDQLLNGIGIDANISYDYTRKKGSISKSKGNASASAGYKLGNFNASGSVGATLFKDGMVAPQFSIDAGVEASVLEADASAEYKNKAKLTEDIELVLAEASAKAKAVVSKLKIGGSAQFGKITKKQKDGTVIVTDDWGVKLKGKVGYTLVGGNVQGSVGLLGAKLSAKAEFDVGIGASFNYEHTNGKVKFSIGLIVGLGGKLSFTIDYGGLVNALTKLLTVTPIKAIYKNHRKKTRAMHTEDRAWRLGAAAGRFA